LKNLNIYFIFKVFLSSTLNKLLNLYKIRILNVCLTTINNEDTQKNNLLENNFNPSNNIINPSQNTHSTTTHTFAYALKDTFDFINKIAKIKLEKDDYIISFDVESLFTNVPINETLEIIKNTFFTKKSTKHVKNESNYHGDLDGIRWEHLENLLKRCLQESVFTFNKKLYKQIDGVSMGSPLGPIIANIFMNDFENKHMDELRKLGVKTWFRYVDDTFVIINNKSQAEIILEYLNKQHPTIKFTMEKEENNTLNFLDVKIKKKKDLSFTTSTYRKPTFTGVMLNWNSLTSIKYKIGLISCLLDRSFKICSSEKQKLIEMEQLRELLIRNNYPNQIIEKEFDRFLKFKSLNNVNTIDPEIKIRYLSLPYMNDKSEIIARKLKELVKEHFHKINLRVAFKAPAELGDHFPFKDKVDDPKKLSGVIYHLKCKNCSDSYIGMTTRTFIKRMSEHKKDKNSHVFQHNSLDNHEIDFDNVEILDRADSELKLQYKEMLYIRKLAPTLNKQLNSELFTLIIRNVQLENSITRDIQKYVKINNKKPTRK
jgi:hypothetical protein